MGWYQMRKRRLFDKDPEDREITMTMKRDNSVDIACKRTTS